MQYYPSNPRGHVVVREDILDAWKEVLYLLSRLGRRVNLAKGERLELQHVKVVVEKPRFEGDAKFKAVNPDPEKLRRYQEDILRGEQRPGQDLQLRPPPAPVFWPGQPGGLRRAANGTPRTARLT